MTAQAITIPEGARVIKPQPGFQEKFIGCPADIAWGGGAAGAGKSFALLLDYLRYANIRGYGGIIFRRTIPEVLNEGGLWDTSEKLLTSLPAEVQPKPNLQSHSWTFPGSKNRLAFSHLQHEKDRLRYQGSQVSYIGFDELTHFTSSQFWYLITRNRSTSGFRPIVRCTMNPQGSGWVKDFLVGGGYLYPDDYVDKSLSGFPILEMDGVIRYFLRHNDVFIWGDSHVEVARQIPKADRGEYTSDDIKSFTFVAGKLSDNPILMKLDPGYKGNLLAQSEEERIQLLGGRWSHGGDDRLKLFSTQALNDLYTNDFVESGENYLTADIAMEGKDLFTIGVWDGWRLEFVYSFPVTLGDEVLKHIQDIARRHKVPGRNIAFDSQGVGNYLKGFMRNSVAVSGSAKPFDIDGQPQRYANLRSQLYFHARDRVEENEAYVAIDRKEEAGKALFSELNVINKKDTPAIKPLAIESKESIKLKIKGSSPDWSDMFVMRSIFDLAPQPKRRISSVAG